MSSIKIISKVLYTTSDRIDTKTSIANIVRLEADIYNINLKIFYTNGEGMKLVRDDTIVLKKDSVKQLIVMLKDILK